MKAPRKPREEPPPAPYLRSKNGTAARLKRTLHTTVDGRWLFRLDYGDVVGTEMWTADQLRALDGVQWLKRRPAELREIESEDLDGEAARPAEPLGEEVGELVPKGDPD